MNTIMFVLVAILPIVGACVVIAWSAFKANQTQSNVPLVLTDRDQLLNNPTKGDQCRLFVHNKLAHPFVTQDCMTDGHYLCSLCARRDPNHPER